MNTIFLLALLALGQAGMRFDGVVQRRALWEELPRDQEAPGYHPVIRFYPGSVFMLGGPEAIVEGHFQVDQGHYTFTPETMFRLNRTDVDKIIADLPPAAKDEQLKIQNRSLEGFTGDYNQDSDSIRLQLKVKGVPSSYQIYDFTHGDENRTGRLTGPEAYCCALWSHPEPYPDILDAKTMFRIEGLGGLKAFFHQAEKSDVAKLAALDVRSDHTYRSGGGESTWTFEGNQLKLKVRGGYRIYTLSDDKTRLMSEGKTAYIKN